MVIELKGYNVGILGATGAVGQEMLNVLKELNFPINELKLFASARSAGKIVNYNGKDYEILLAEKGAFKGLDFVLGAASNAVATELASDIVSSGAVFIDNSSAFRMNDDVPLVVPEVNGEDVFKHKGIISNPNCSTIIAMVAVNGINKLSKIKAINAATYQATSGAGANGPIELRNQMKAIINGDALESNVFQYQIVENVIPQIGSFLENGYTTEEMKMQNEGRKIMHLPELLVNCTCVRVPVVRSHSIALTVVTEDLLDIEEVKKSIENSAGVKLYDDPANRIYPMPIITSNQDLVYVGRIRKDLINEKGISIWCAGDQVRKGAATNAIQIMMKLVGLI